MSIPNNLKAEDISAISALYDLIEHKNKVIIAQKAELDRVYAELRDEQAKNRAAADALKGNSHPDLPTVNMPTMMLEEFAPSASKPNGAAKNLLADSFVL